MKTFALSTVASRAWFWILFGLLSIITVILLFVLPNAFYLIDRPVTLDREGVLEAARQAASTYDIGPDHYRDALVYRTDTRAKSFIELEGGGVTVLNQAMSNGSYSPYSWHVRHFNEGETWEAVLYFSSDGRLNGFYEKLPETETNSNLEKPKARGLAEGALREAYGYDLAVYKLVETSSEEKIAGRVDWTFVYENEAETIGEGRIRLAAVVSGNRLTGISQYLKVPESFERRFTSSRSWNTFISIFSLIGMALLSVAAIWGLVYLLRERILIWRAPIVLGFLLSLMMVPANLNSLSVQWMSYNTALSAPVFLTNLLLVNVVLFVVMGVVFALSIMVAEGLTRRAFPDHIQFWGLFSGTASGTALKKTGGALLSFPFWLLYVFLFYDVTKNFLGWWVPAESLTDPNVVAQYVPWFTPFAGAIQAGVWEEMFFRALPIAGAALIGERLKKRNLFIGGAVALQAMVFAAGHAGYPGLPGYSRLVELFVPAVAFGLIFLRFGILPCILIHFGYDIVLMAQPIFNAPKGSMWFDRALIILLILLPVLISLFIKLRSKKADTYKPLPVNGVWIKKKLSGITPEKKSGSLASAPWEDITSIRGKHSDDGRADTSRIESGGATGESVKTTGETGWAIGESDGATGKSGGAVGFGLAHRIAYIVCIVFGFGAWIVFADFSVGTGDFAIEKNEAEDVADAALELRDITIPDSWKRSTSAITSPGIADRYVWSEARSEYDRLKGTYLPPNRWRIRYTDFESEAELRERYEIVVCNTGEILRIAHSVPESKAGALLSRERAETIATGVLWHQFQIRKDEARIVSGTDKKLPERVDWVFDYSIPKDAAGDIDTRVRVVIAGDEVVDAFRYVFIPEEWRRELNNSASKLSIASRILSFMSLAVFVAGVIQGIIALAKKRFSFIVFLSVGGSLLFSRLAAFGNDWPTMAETLNPMWPYEIQMALLPIIGIIAVLIPSAASGIIAGFLWERHRHGFTISREGILRGLGIGSVIAGSAALCTALIPSVLPGTAAFRGVDSIFPWAETSLRIIGVLPTTVIGFALVLSWFRYLQRWALLSKVIGAGLIFLYAGASAKAGVAVPNLGGLLAVATIAGLSWLIFAYTAFRRNSAALPTTIGVLTLLSLIKLVVQNPFPMAIPSAVLGIIVTIAMVLFLTGFQEVENQCY